MKFEHERIKKEKKLKEKQIREEYEKKLKEAKKTWVLRERELTQRKKEEMRNFQSLEKFRSPPFGMNNYGNTCYFNTVNQILLNLPILQQIFLDKRINLFINKKNRFGHRGKLFESFKSLYWIQQSYFNNNVKSLKEIIGEINEDFNNNNQQDAKNYLNFLIENLHEEINLQHIKKNIEEKYDIFNHNTLEELGNISWSNNLRNNASFIDSIFKFQLCSNIKCRECGNIKYNFENVYSIDLPLPFSKMITVEIYLYRLPFIYKLYYHEINEKFRIILIITIIICL